MSDEPKISILDIMKLNTSYLKEELAYLTDLPLSIVVQDLKKFQADGKIELTNTNNYEFWSKKDEAKERRQTATKSV